MTTAYSACGYASMDGASPLQPLTYQVRAEPDEVVVRVECCGVCGSDVHMISNDWPGLTYPLVAGHEVVGTVVSAGASTPVRLAVGTRVGIGHISRTCGTCRYCLAGNDEVCEHIVATAAGPRHAGGFGSHVVAQAKHVFPIPAALPSEQAAPLLCGGITVYSPLLAYDVRPGDRVGIIGMGGLGHLAVQFAKAWGCHVTVFSTSAAKEAEARALGAHTFVVSSDAAAMAACVDTLDFIYYLVPYDIDWELYMSILRRNGTLCVMAGAPAPMSIRTTSLFLPNNHKQIVGRNIGPAAWHLRMLEFAALHGIRAVVESFPLGEVNAVVEQVRTNAVRFRAVLTHEGQFKFADGPNSPTTTMSSAATCPEEKASADTCPEVKADGEAPQRIGCCGAPAPALGASKSAGWDGDGMAQWYSRWMSPGTAAITTSMFGHLGLLKHTAATVSEQPVQPPVRVLETHCGDACAAANLLPSPAVASYTVCDFSAAMLAAATARLGDKATVVLADATQLPFEDASFDCYCSNLGICCTPDLSSKLAEARRVLAPGGGVAAMSMRIEGGEGDTAFRLIQEALTPFGLPPGPDREGLFLGNDLPALRARVEAAGFEQGSAVAWRTWATLPVHDAAAFVDFATSSPPTRKFLEGLQAEVRAEAEGALRVAAAAALDNGAIQVAVAVVVARC